MSIKKAYATGALSSEYGGEKVTYRSLADMERIMAKMESELGINGNETAHVRINVITNKGLNGCHE